MGFWISHLQPVRLCQKNGAPRTWLRCGRVVCACGSPYEQNHGWYSSTIQSSLFTIYSLYIYYTYLFIVGQICIYQYLARRIVVDSKSMFSWSQMRFWRWTQLILPPIRPQMWLQMWVSHNTALVDCCLYVFAFFQHSSETRASCGVFSIWYVDPVS